MLTKIKNVEIGNTIKLGDFNWIIVSHLEDNTTMAVLQQTLPKINYSEENTIINYEDSKVRQYLLDYFIPMLIMNGLDIEYLVPVIDDLNDKITILDKYQYLAYNEYLESTDIWLRSMTNKLEMVYNEDIITSSHTDNKYGVRPIIRIKSDVFIRVKKPLNRISSIGDKETSDNINLLRYQLFDTIKRDFKYQQQISTDTINKLNVLTEILNDLNRI